MAKRIGQDLNNFSAKPPAFVSGGYKQDDGYKRMVGRQATE